MEIELICNTDDAVLFGNIAANSKRHYEWAKELPAHDGHAVIVGGGPSLAENLWLIKKRYDLGQTIFALNGAAKFLNANGIKPHYQVILDAREENVTLIDVADQYLIASQCNPAVFEKLDGQKVTVWHPAIEHIEPYLTGYESEYALIGGGLTVGLSSMCLTYALGFRKLHLFGYDCSHRNTLGHAYSQKMNDREPLCKVTVDGQVFTASLTMARQAELFPTVCNNLIDLGCIITVDADGLIKSVLKSMRENPSPTTEAEKYQMMWDRDAYRTVSPGELVSDLAIEICGITSNNTVIDFGCGTGRGGKAIHAKTGAQVTLVDFAANCRDTGDLNFIVADLTKPMTLEADIGYCTDVMEHIPTKDVAVVIENIMCCVDRAFFQISLIPDNMGALIGEPLHLSVFPVEWWLQQFSAWEVLWSQADGDNAMFYVQHQELQ
jgi:hypothetical protein